MIGITILGATGTIGLNTLDVISRHRDTYEVVALTAHNNVARLFEQCQTWQPCYAVMANEQAAEQLQHKIQQAGLSTTVLSGVEGLTTVAALPEVEAVMAAIVGGAGLLPTLAAAKAGKKILLANKEALVMSGDLFMQAVRDNNATLLPIDSEHNAIFQCMPPAHTQQENWDGLGIDQIMLTASGGPFRTKPLSALPSVTPEQACAHPNWVMGRKISVDSATMMNKGLEVIEACWLFHTNVERIEVVLHPQSVIHSMVSYVDGSVLAQLGNPDMRTPIAHALAYPQRINSGVSRLNMVEVARLDFEKTDFKRFPCLDLAYQAMKAGGTSTTILNAANEIAVEAFLNKQIRFTDIATVIDRTLSALQGRTAHHIDTILDDDAQARGYAHTLLGEL